ncbi:beta-crystallin A2-like isoform X1 [Lampetra fluviatilis]
MKAGTAQDCVDGQHHVRPPLSPQRRCIYIAQVMSSQTSAVGALLPGGQFKLTLWEQENFQGKRCELTTECPGVTERPIEHVRSIKVECGAWVGFEHPEFQGQQFVLEKGDYPMWQSWSGSCAYRTERIQSFRPIKSAAHGESKVVLFEGENLQGRKTELCDDCPSMQAMGWSTREIQSVKVNSGAWVAYQYPGYRGYQFVLERDRHSGEYKSYSEFGSQAHSGNIQSIRRIQH